MNVRELVGPPPPALAGVLAEFETQFSYPLGPGRTFRISHGDDYTRFYRAMGESVCFVAEADCAIAGTLGVAFRNLILPEGRECAVAYVGDLKITPAARGGRTLLKLLRAAHVWSNGRARAAFAVVMDGTEITPEKYSGRASLPAFRKLGAVAVLRVSTQDATAGDCCAATCESALASFRRLSAGRHALCGGDPELRSGIPPSWIMCADGSACGRIEDTMKAKRLFASDGSELSSVHLSCFAYRTIEAGAALLRVALGRASHLGFPALFVSVAEPDAAAFLNLFPGMVAAPATIYGTGLASDALWNINTAEI